MPCNEAGQVSYMEFERMLNWRDNAVAPPPAHSAVSDDYQGAPHKNQVININFALFVSDLK